jgi:hypothetical protein
MKSLPATTPAAAPLPRERIKEHSTKKALEISKAFFIWTINID